MKTIFDSVVSKENDHSNLLRNVLERYPHVASATLSCFVGSKFSAEQAALFDYRTQIYFSTENVRGIPDVVINGQQFRCVIEVKVDPWLDLTDAQRNGYSAFFSPSSECFLVFLVPNEWRHRKSAEEAIKSLAGVAKGYICSWSDLIDVIEKASKVSSDGVLQEVAEFWKGQFQFHVMTEEEKVALESVTENAYSAVSSLEKSILQAKAYFARRRSDLTTALETTNSEYGFYLKRNEQYLLWIGYWPALCPGPCFGFPSGEKGEWHFPTTRPSEPETGQSYRFWRLSRESWGDPEKVYAEVSQFIDACTYN